jgi:hypothetical protein
MTRIALLLALVACGPEKNENPTKPGTVLLTWNWNLAEAERIAMRTAKQTDVKTQALDFEQAVDFDKKVPVKVKVALETATLTFEEKGKQVEHRAPMKVTITAVDANDFTLSNAKCMGPYYDMHLPPGRDMILHCIVKVRKPRYDVSLTFYAYGDNRIDDGNPKTFKVYP